VADVPDLDAALATRVHVSRGVADGHCTHHLPVVEGVDLASVSGDSGSNEGIRGKGDRLHLAVCSDMEGVCTFKERRENILIIKRSVTTSALLYNKDSKKQSFSCDGFPFEIKD
jgi:hypothetical protein